jgi:cytochrome P450
MNQGNPPGPRGTELFSGALDWQRNGLAALERLAQRYGDIASASVFGKRVYLFSHPDHIQRVLIDNSDNYHKTKGNENAQLYFGDSMQLNNGDMARRLRRLMTPMFQLSRVSRDFCDPTVETTRESIDGWTSGPRPTLTADLMEMALRVAVRIHFGTAPGADTEQLAGLFRSALGQLNSFLPPGWIPSPGNRRYREAIARLDQDVLRRIVERHQTGPVGPDLLSCFVGLKGETGPAMSDPEIRHELVSMMAAGYQTVGIAINQTLRLVAQHPAADALLAEEVTRVLGDRPAQPEDLAELPYSEKIVKESLRCAPPAGALARLVAAEDTVGGWKIAAKSQVFVSSWVMHRDARYYSDPLLFKPERWTPQFERELPLCAYFPFGRGARSCVAGAMSSVMLRLMLVTIVRQFRLEALVPNSGEPRPFDRGDVAVVLSKRDAV